MPIQFIDGKCHIKKQKSNKLPYLVITHAFCMTYYYYYSGADTHTHTPYVHGWKNFKKSDVHGPHVHKSILSTKIYSMKITNFSNCWWFIKFYSLESSLSYGTVAKALLSQWHIKIIFHIFSHLHLHMFNMVNYVCSKMVNWLAHRFLCTTYNR